LNQPHKLPSDTALVEWGVDCFVGEFAVIGLRPMANAANRRALTNDEPRPVVIGDRTIIGTHCTIYRDVTMGEDCRLGDHVVIREGARIGDRCVVGSMVDLQYGVQLADDVRVLNQVQLAGGSTVGRGSFIGPGTQTANDLHVAHHGLDDYQDRGQNGITIGEYVFIGAAAVLLPGITIGDRAIVAAGAVVTKDVAPGATVYGLPAKPSRESEWRVPQHLEVDPYLARG
jgi:acetyltransferase-like isoleucine patch superfamily enzyme